MPTRNNKKKKKKFYTAVTSTVLRTITDGYYSLNFTRANIVLGQRTPGR